MTSSPCSQRPISQLSGRPRGWKPTFSLYLDIEKASLEIQKDEAEI